MAPKGFAGRIILGVMALFSMGEISPVFAADLPAPLVFVRDNMLWKLLPGQDEPRLITWVRKDEAWASPASPVFHERSADTIFFSAYRFRRFPPNIGAINIDIANLYMAGKDGVVEPITTRNDISVTPDYRSTNLVFVSNQHAFLKKLMPQTNTSEIFMLQSTKGLAQRITGDGGTKYNPRWSPDGKKVAYLGFKGQKAGIYVVDIEERVPRLILEGGVNYPTWRPDGRALAFVDAGKLYEIELDETQMKANSAPRQLLGLSTPGYVSFSRWTDWGILFQWARKKEQGLSLYDPKTGKARVLISGNQEMGGADLARKFSF